MSVQANVTNNLSNSISHLVLKNSLKHWRYYARHKHNRKHDARKAIYHRNVSLEQKALNAFSKNCVEAKRGRFIDERSSTGSNDPETIPEIREFPRLQLLKRTCHFWHVYAKKQRRRNLLNARIINFRNDSYLRKYIAIWKLAHSEKKRNNYYDKKAIDHYRRSLLKKSLKSWVDEHNRRFVINAKFEMANAHRRRELLRRIWLCWIKYHNGKIARFNRIDEMRNFYERKLIARSLKKLSSNVFANIAKRRMLEEARSHYFHRLASKIIRSWANYRFERKELKIKMILRQGRIENSTKREVLRQWRYYVWTKKCQRRKENVSKNHYLRKMAESALSKLKNYVIYRKRKITRLSYLKIGIEQISLYTLKSYIDKWRIAVVFAVQTRQKIRRAEDHWSSRQVERYFTIWTIFVQRHKIKKRRKNALKEIGKIVLLEKYTNLWFEKYKIVATIRKEEIWAYSIHEKKLQLRLFNVWKRYVDEKTRERREIEEAEKFHGKILLRECLKKTLKKCLIIREARYEDRLSIVKKNSVDDFETLRKFFNRWSSLIFIDENEKNCGGVDSEKKTTKPCEYSHAMKSTRPVLPEYMLRNARAEMGDNFKYSEFEKIFLASRIGRIPSLDDDTRERPFAYR